MKGARSGVQRLIKNECPHALDVGCICHLADLTIKSGVKSLPVDIDQLFIDVFYYFFHSSKRKQEFCDLWCSLFTSEPQTILKHCPTRWLSLLRCVGRFISQFDGLKSYFLSCSEAETWKVVSMKIHLQNLSFSFSHISFHQWIGLIACFNSHQKIPLVSCIVR